MKLIHQVEMLKEDYELKHPTKQPKYLILSPAEAGELAYEVGIEEGMSEEDAVANNLTYFNNMFVCIVFDKDFTKLDVA